MSEINFFFNSYVFTFYHSRSSTEEFLQIRPKKFARPQAEFFKNSLSPQQNLSKIRPVLSNLAGKIYKS